MKINIGIVGYGNLGRAVEQVILSNHNYNLVAIFSRRLVKSKFNTLIENYENITLYNGKIDVMMLCGGSSSDLENQSKEAVKHFDCINTFDNHKMIVSELEKLNSIASKHNHRIIIACGWDPGIFSIVRALAYSISNTFPSVFWGKGISMGHSEAIRKVKNVFDGVEFTIPNRQTIKLARHGKLLGTENYHSRECYVVAEKKYHRQIASDIKNIPEYFKGQPTTINFVTENQLLKLKSKMYHRGEIISKFKTIHGSNCLIDFKVKMDSNPNFTATVMSRYINAIINLKNKNQAGAFTCLDIPPIYLFDEEKRLYYTDKLC